MSAEWWSTVGQLIERRQIIIPNDEKLIAQLTSRRKLYDSKGREKLESKADLRGRGAESPDRADALIGSIVLGQQVNFDWQEELEDWKRIKRQMELGIGSNAMFPQKARCRWSARNRRPPEGLEPNSERYSRNKRWDLGAGFL